MMHQEVKQQVVSRLRRIEGQIRGVISMVEADRYCMDILAQTRSVTAALRSAEELIMENHLNTCVADALKSDDPTQKQEKIDEMMGLFSQYRKQG